MGPMLPTSIAPQILLLFLAVRYSLMLSVLSVPPCIYIEYRDITLIVSLTALHKTGQLRKNRGQGPALQTNIGEGPGQEPGPSKTNVKRPRRRVGPAKINSKKGRASGLTLPKQIGKGRVKGRPCQTYWGRVGLKTGSSCNHRERAAHRPMPAP